MTAIFAYAAGDIAFIASDTKRASHGHATVACKIERWSETTLIAQTGHGEGLQRLVGHMLAWQHRNSSWTSGAGAEHIFGQVGAQRRTDEIAALKRKAYAPSVHGTLVVAEASRNGVPAQIFTLQWAAGGHVLQAGPVYADGSDQRGFQIIGDAQFAAMGGGGSGFDLAAWGMSCIDQARRQPAGSAVDWPADLAICRIDNGVPVTAIQRVAGLLSQAHPIFVT